MYEETGTHPDRMARGHSYTPAQQEAIETVNKNLRVIACAGSGKTSVMAARIVRILRDKRAEGISPESIVALAFNTKAAAELKERIGRLHQEEVGHRNGLAGMTVATIHSFGFGLLQKYVPDYLRCDMLDEVRQRLFIDRFWEQSGMKSLGLKRWVASDLYVTILRILRESRLDRVALGDHPVLAALKMYRKLLRQHNYLDYDEILYQAVLELKDNAGMREQVGQRVRYLVVDEYQDVSPIQEQLIRLLYEMGANVCVCGDDDQNVYPWRGSDPVYIKEFAERYQDVARVALETNFRSTAGVVNVAQSVLKPIANRLPKAMQSSGQRRFEYGDLLCREFSGPKEEAAWIADRILAMRGHPYDEQDGTVRGLSWSDCVILLRSVRHCAAPILAALRDLKIPAVVTGMTGLFEMPEVRAAVGVFEFLAKQITADALKTLWRKADLGLSEEDIERGIALLDARLVQLAEREEQKVDTGVLPSVGGRIVQDTRHDVQVIYHDFLTSIQLREERVPGERGEVALFNLGKFSKVVSDFESINYWTKPRQRFTLFVKFLQHQAPTYYPQGGQDAGYAVPDAVRIATIHQVKGMEFPVVFLPCLQANRFPTRRMHNRVWDYLPPQAVVGASRYDTTEEDERRLLYVGLTRSEKFVLCSWAPDEDNQLYRQASPFYTEMTRREAFLTKEPPPKKIERLTPMPRQPLVNVMLSFTEIRYLFDCPYQFKLRWRYGFDPAVRPELGYGRSLHNALAELHRRSMAGERIREEDYLDQVTDLLDRHLVVRFAIPELGARLRKSAQIELTNYLCDQGPLLDRVEHVEENVEVILPGGIVVSGRIDLIKRTDTGEELIWDGKTQERAPEEDVTTPQLYVYALGHEQRFERRADLLEVYNLSSGSAHREVIDDALLAKTTRDIQEVGEMLRRNDLPRLPAWCPICDHCDVAGLCRDRATATQPDVTADTGTPD